MVTSPNKLPIGILGPIFLSFYITKKGGVKKNCEGILLKISDGNKT